MLIMLYYHF